MITHIHTNKDMVRYLLGEYGRHARGGRFDSYGAIYPLALKYFLESDI